MRVKITSSFLQCCYHIFTHFYLFTHWTLILSLGCPINNTCEPLCGLEIIGEAETPCDNNGVCILGSQPDEYTCDCTNTGYTGTNCTGM